MQQPDTVTLTIDGKQVQAPKGTLVLHAAQKLGIDIPTFCYHKKMDPLGACRMCLVSIEKQKGFPPSCATPVAEGMIVTTKSAEVEKTRKGMLEFLLINHPLDCPICDKGGECPLQNLTFKFGPGTSRMVEPKRHFQKRLQMGPQIVLDRERCILCQLCVRFMEDVADDPQLVMINRGGSTEIGTFPGRPLDSVFSGNVTDICPVGALTSKSYRFQSRPWDLEHTPSVCPTCAVGCNIDINARRGQLMRITPRENDAIDDGWLCDIGRYGTLSWARFDRVTSPLVKRHGAFLPVSWDEALRTVIDGLRASRAHGTLAGLASARNTNEELYLFGRILRGSLRTPHVDTLHGSRGGTADIGGASIAAIDTADALVLIDADPLARQMVLHLRLTRAAKKNGVRPVVISNDETGMDKHALTKIGFDETNLTGALSALVTAVNHVKAGKKTSSDAIGLAAASLANAQRGLILYDEHVLDRPDAAQVLASIRDLESLICRTTDGTSGGVLALAKDTNSRGAAEMGASPHLIAGGKPLDRLEWFNTVTSRWGLPVSPEVGMNTGAILHSAAEGQLSGLYLLDTDPLSEWPDETMARDALAKVPFLVVQSALMTPTAQEADVVLPSAGFAEKNGTLTNLEGRIQSLGTAVEIPGEARDGWEILHWLEQRLGVLTTYASAGAVTQEIIDTLALPAWQCLGDLPAGVVATVGGDA